MSLTEEGDPVSLHAIWQVYRVPILLGVASLLFIVLSLAIFIKSYQTVTPITFSSDQKEASGQATASGYAESMMVVDIEGAVVRPGVYRLAVNSRVSDAIDAAGGLRSDADEDAIARSINRAAKLTDGAKLYIPFVGEVQDGASNDGVSATTININTASPSELEVLPGVGPVTAGKIVGGRPYMRLEELVEKKVIGQSLFDKLKSQLTL